MSEPEETGTISRTGRHNRRGRNRHKQTPKARQQQAATRSYWQKRETPLLLANEQWRVIVHRGGLKDYVILDDEVTQLTWVDKNDILTGEVIWQKFEHQFHPKPPPRPGKKKAPPPGPLVPETGYGGIREGNVFELQWRPMGAGQWKEVWRMRAWQPSIEESTGTITMQLQSDMAYLQRSKDSFTYGKTRKHPFGMRLDTIAKDIAKRYQFRLTKLPKLAHRIKTFSVKGSPLEALQKVLLLERNEGGGKRLFMRFEAGGVAILPLKQSRDLLILGPALIDATVNRQLSPNFVSALTVRGSFGGVDPTAKTNKTRRKISIKVDSPSSIRRFGYVHAEVSAPSHIKSITAARKFARQTLHNRFNVTKEITLTHPGIPTVRAKDAVLIQLPDDDVDLLAWITEASHTLQPGDYSMELTFRYTDPFVDTTKTAKKRAQTARKRKRQPTRSDSRAARRRPQPKASQQRRSR